jgi:hypothetical protein
MPPDFIAVGHATLDLIATPLDPIGEIHHGGAVTYGAALAARHGWSAGVVTSTADDFDFDKVLPGVEIANTRGPNTSTFINDYRSGSRRQSLAARAKYLDWQAVPADWRSPRMALLGPLTNEMPMSALDWFPDATVVAVPQGWFRSWSVVHDHSDEISESQTEPKKGWSEIVLNPRPPQIDSVTAAGHRTRSRIAAVVAATDEMPDSIVSDWLKVSEAIVLTEGERGAVFVTDDGAHRVPAFTVDEIDPTGAGDVWAAAYAVWLAETGDREKAALCASAAAGLSVTGQGLAGIPDKSAVDRAAAQLVAGM